jgi:aminoglycoside phosphotransferase (APT) family kinase protein
LIATQGTTLSSWSPMDSFSKIPLSAAQAEAIVKQHFGSKCTLNAFEELREGYFNAAARLELRDGRKLVLKAAPPDEVRVMRYEKNLMKAEVEAMRLVGERTRVPVPVIVAYDTSRSLLPSDFFLMEFLPGTPFHKLRPQLAPEAQRRVERQMGRMTRELSAVTNPSFGYWAQPDAPGAGWRECFTRMLQGVLEDGYEMGVDLRQPYDQLYGAMERHFGVLEEVRTPCLVHWDLWDGNVFVDPSTLRITGLIDFERVMWADPLIEAVFAFGKHDPNSAYVEGFGEKLFLDPNQVLRRMLYNAYLYLIMIIECTFRRYPTHDQENWSRERLAETLNALAAA